MAGDKAAAARYLKNVRRAGTDGIFSHGPTSRRILEWALRRRPGDTMAKELLAVQMYSCGEVEETVIMFAGKKKFSGTGLGEMILGLCYLRYTRDIDYAEYYLKKSVQKLPHTYYSYHLLNAAYAARGKAARRIKITADKMEHAGEIFHEIMRNKLKYKEIPITVIYDKYTLTKGQAWRRSVGLGIKMIIKRLMR